MGLYFIVGTLFLIIAFFFIFKWKYSLSNKDEAIKLILAESRKGKTFFGDGFKSCFADYVNGQSMTFNQVCYYLNSIDFHQKYDPNWHYTFYVDFYSSKKIGDVEALRVVYTDTPGSRPKSPYKSKTTKIFLADGLCELSGKISGYLCVSKQGEHTFKIFVCDNQDNKIACLRENRNFQLLDYIESSDRKIRVWGFFFNSSLDHKNIGEVYIPLNLTEKYVDKKIAEFLNS